MTTRTNDAGKGIVGTDLPSPPAPPLKGRRDSALRTSLGLAPPLLWERGIEGKVRGESKRQQGCYPALPGWIFTVLIKSVATD
jgi:hypothetical protein